MVDHDFVTPKQLKLLNRDPGDDGPYYSGDFCALVIKAILSIIAISMFAFVMCILFGSLNKGSLVGIQEILLFLKYIFVSVGIIVAVLSTFAGMCFLLKLIWSN